jgi:hypothetical protein
VTPNEQNVHSEEDAIITEKTTFAPDLELAGVIKVKSIEEEIERPGEETEGPERDVEEVQNNEAAAEGGSISEEEDSVQFSTSEAQRNVPIRAKKSPFTFLKKLINGMSVSSGGRKNRIGTYEGKSASVEVDSKGRGRRGHGKVSPETLPASKSVFDLSEGFSASHRSNKWKLRKSVSA